MAKLGSYYGLCPLIDQRNLLGIAEDLETNNVIVTLGRNIAIKYRLSDQKQIHSWRTKDKFSSPIIYDAESEEYVAVFNQIYIRTWKGDEEHLDKLKKNKFNNPIHTLIAISNKSFVIFKNGSVVPLSTAIRNRKSANLDSEDTLDNIIDVLSAPLGSKIFIGILQEIKSKLRFTWYIFEEDEQTMNNIILSQKNKEITLVGQVLCQLQSQNQMNLLTLWSDGKLFSYPLEAENDLDSSRIEPPGSLFAIVESLSCKQLVTMVFLNHHYIAMYGAASNEEGAILILYNTQFKVSQSRQTLKLFTSGAKLWKIENNLLFCVGQNLAVIPFCLNTEQLAALVGSHRDALNDLDPDITVVEELQCAKWDNMPTDQSNIKTIPNQIKAKVKELLKQGLSEAIICEELLFEYLANNNIQAIWSCLEYFNDIPEMYLAKILKFCLTVDSDLFKTTQNQNINNLPDNLQPPERCLLLNRVLMCPFSDVLLLPYIQIELDLNCTIIMLQYICYLMSENDCLLPMSNISESEMKLIEWGCVLLDANYQKLLLSKDTSILQILASYNSLVKEYLVCLDNLTQVVPLLMEIKKGKILNKNKHTGNLKYSIEKLTLY